MAKSSTIRAPSQASGLLAFTLVAPAFLARAALGASVSEQWRFLAGLVIAILALAGVALVAVLLGRLLDKRSGLSFVCSGEADMETCRTCNFVRGAGDGLICERYGLRIKPDAHREEDRPGG